jgi:hypothetical protein
MSTAMLRSCAYVYRIMLLFLSISLPRATYSRSAWHNRFGATVTVPRHEAPEPTPDALWVWDLLVTD